MYIHIYIHMYIYIYVYMYMYSVCVCVISLYLYFLGLRIYCARAPRSPAEGTACGAATAAGGPRSPPIPAELGGIMGL